MEAVLLLLPLSRTVLRGYSLQESTSTHALGPVIEFERGPSTPVLPTALHIVSRINDTALIRSSDVAWGVNRTVHVTFAPGMPGLVAQWVAGCGCDACARTAGPGDLDRSWSAPFVFPAEGVYRLCVKPTRDCATWSQTNMTIDVRRVPDPCPSPPSPPPPPPPPPYPPLPPVAEKKPCPDNDTLLDPRHVGHGSPNVVHTQPELP
jgi:hypothetical protein